MIESNGPVLERHIYVVRHHSPSNYKHMIVEENVERACKRQKAWGEMSRLCKSKHKPDGKLRLLIVLWCDKFVRLWMKHHCCLYHLYIDRVSYFCHEEIWHVSCYWFHKIICTVRISFAWHVTFVPTHCSWEMWKLFYKCIFQTHLLWADIVNTAPEIGHRWVPPILIHWQYVNIGSGGLVLSSSNPLPEPMLTQIHVLFTELSI